MSTNVTVAALGVTALILTASTGSLLPTICVAVVLYLWRF